MTESDTWRRCSLCLRWRADKGQMSTISPASRGCQVLRWWVRRRVVAVSNPPTNTVDGLGLVCGLVYVWVWTMRQLLAARDCILHGALSMCRIIQVCKNYTRARSIIGVQRNSNLLLDVNSLKKSTKSISQPIITTIDQIFQDTNRTTNRASLAEVLVMEFPQGKTQMTCFHLIWDLRQRPILWEFLPHLSFLFLWDSIDYLQ